MVSSRRLCSVTRSMADSSGAAKLPIVLKVSLSSHVNANKAGFQPKDPGNRGAGQVLEAHALATLFPSIEHVIAIGDPLQLRPNINCYGEIRHPNYWPMAIWLMPCRSFSRASERT